MRRYVVYGAGAVGGTVGAALAQVGCEVVLIARGAHREAIAAGGLCFQTPRASVTVHLPVVGSPEELEWTSEDVVVLGMKSQGTADALRALADVAPVPPAVFCAQNGVANERAALRFFPRVYGVRVNLPVSHLSPGAVCAHAAPVYGLLDVGRYPRGDDELARTVALDLSSAGFASRSDAAIMRWKYFKLLTNLQNAVDACCTPGDHDAPELCALAREEGGACFAAAGIDAATVEEDRERRSAAGTTTIQSVEYPGNSTWQSLTRGEPTEVDYLNGEIVLLGRLHGVPTPINAVLQAATHRMAHGHTAPGSLRAADLLRTARRI